MNYANFFVKTWRDSELKPAFATPVYFFAHDGKNYAYETEGDIWQFLFWVVGVIHDTTSEMQNDNEQDDVFLDRAGVSYGMWNASS